MQTAMSACCVCTHAHSAALSRHAQAHRCTHEAHTHMRANKQIPAQACNPSHAHKRTPGACSASPLPRRWLSTWTLGRAWQRGRAWPLPAEAAVAQWRRQS